MYYRYRLQKKQQSTDNGSTWTDVSPLETRKGSVVGTYDTYSDCMSGTPTPTPYASQYLTFESLEDGNKFRFNMNVIIGSQSENRYVAEPRTISASTDGGQTWFEWTSNVGGNNPIITINAGEKLLLKGENDSYADVIVDEYGTHIPKCGLSGEKNFKIYGNIMSMLSGDNFVENKTITEDYAFYKFLSGKLTTESGVSAFFNVKDISNLVLPATTLTKGCYCGLFTQFACITTAPELPATTLASSCYDGMFYKCKNLNYIKCLATDISATDCTSDWVSNVSSSGTFVKAASMTGWTTGSSGIPDNWTVQNA